MPIENDPSIEAIDNTIEAIETVAPAEPVRRDMRPPLREEDPRAAAARRTAEILGHLGGINEGTDKFYVSPDMIPDGWTYEWKRRTVMGQEDPAYQVALARTGWEPVPLQRHPEMMPVNWKGTTIEVEGMMLMQRPKEITDRIEELDRRAARNQVRTKEQQLATAPPGTLQSEYTNDKTRPKISKSYEAMPVPADKP